MGENLSLFDEPNDESIRDETSCAEQGHFEKSRSVAYRPLADRLRPKEWSDFVGLSALDENLVSQLRNGVGNPPSLILWGPPGCGKTTLAKLIGASFPVRFVEFSAVLGGVKEVRAIVASAKLASKRTILFVDEIHRFNRAQQDAFLPHIENGTIILIGATTENPSFYLTGALLSRAKTIQFAGISEGDLLDIAHRGAQECGLGVSEEGLKLMCACVGGDARRLLNTLEGLRELFQDERAGMLGEVDLAAVKSFLAAGGVSAYDRSGEQHYNMASAFIKSLRGSDPDAALFWAFRMLEGGEDPRFLTRRMMIFASEDIGNADPRALQLAVSTSDAFEKLGLPEGRIPIAQCVTYLACAPKSNRSYAAMHKAVAAVKAHSYVTVPLHLRNAPTALMKELDYGKGYEYPHSSETGHVEGAHYLPVEVGDVQFYEPVNRGYEKMINERLAEWRRSKKKGE